MCGIAGIYYLDGRYVQEDTLVSMTSALAHRGPDDQGIYLNRHIGLGHRRLSILDLSQMGHQPMTYEDTGFWITYNGEVYNYIELKKELAQHGYKFRSRTDTEVILAAYHHWGLSAFEKFNGMWAIGIYEEKENTLLLCRDRYGIKPLYYYWNNGTIAFSSEYKGFLAVRDELDLENDTVGWTTALQNPFMLEASGYSLFRHVYNLLPGKMLIVDQHKVQEKTWWRTIDHLEEVPRSRKAQADKFRDLFSDSCRLRMRSDVPIGTSLSGGLDSSSVVAMLAQLGFRDNYAFSHAFPGTVLDESHYAKIVSDTTGVPIRFVEVDEDLLSGLDGVLFSFESIYAGMPGPAERVYRAQRDAGVIVTLDGHGVDEMLAGYHGYVLEALRDTNVFIHPKCWYELIRLYSQMTGISYHRSIKAIINKKAYEAIPDRVRQSLRRQIMRKTQSINYLGGKNAHVYSWQKTNLPATWSHLKTKLYLDFHHTLLPRILKNFDVASMANSIEVRMPFMDYRIVNYVFSLPDTAIINDNYTKIVLRDAMLGILDERIRLRKSKIGFNSPLTDWLPGVLRPWVEDILLNNEYELDIIDKQALQKYYRENVLNKNISWSQALYFWKHINALKLNYLFKSRSR